MNRTIGAALSVVGIRLMVYGFDASDAVISDISRAFTGAPTNKTLWLLLGGSLSVVIGMALIFQRSSKV